MHCCMSTTFLLALKRRIIAIKSLTWSNSGLWLRLRLNRHRLFFFFCIASHVRDKIDKYFWSIKEYKCWIIPTLVLERNYTFRIKSIKHINIFVFFCRTKKVHTLYMYYGFYLHALTRQSVLFADTYTVYFAILFSFYSFFTSGYMQE